MTVAGALVDRVTHGIVVTDAAGRISTANRLAQTILAEADGLLIRNGRLVAARRDESARLSRLILDAAGGGPAGRLNRPGGAMQISRPSQRRALPVVVTPLRGSRSVCVAFNDPECVPEAHTYMLARLYSLTPREAAVAGLLGQGQSPMEAADTLAMRMTTMRTHIQHLYLKTGTSRLPELVHLLLRSPAGF